MKPSSLEGYDDRPVTVLIGTGEYCWDYDSRVVMPKYPTLDSCIAALVGYSEVTSVHLYGEWETLIPKATFNQVWRSNMTRQPVLPAVYVDGTQVSMPLK